MKKIIIVILIGISVAACSTPPQPKKPDESHRVPVNKTTPIEVLQGVQ